MTLEPSVLSRSHLFGPSIKNKVLPKWGQLPNRGESRYVASFHLFQNMLYFTVLVLKECMCYWNAVCCYYYYSRGFKQMGVRVMETQASCNQPLRLAAWPCPKTCLALMELNDMVNEKAGWSKLLTHSLSEFMRLTAVWEYDSFSTLLEINVFPGGAWSQGWNLMLVVYKNSSDYIFFANPLRTWINRWHVPFKIRFFTCQQWFKI